MIEFLKNLWQWVLNNKDAIVTFITSAQFVGFVSAIIMIVKNIKASKDNTASTKILTDSTDALNESLKGNELVKSAMEKVNSSIQESLKSVDGFENKIQEFNGYCSDQFTVLSEKINAMLEVQSIVYSTIKDESIRTSVNNILLSAKYSEEEIQNSLQKQIDELKAKIKENAEVMQTVVDESATKLAETTEKIVEVKNKTKKSNVIRG